MYTLENCIEEFYFL